MKSFYQFSAGETVAHKLDPRTKLIFVLCLMIAAFIVPEPWWLFLGVIVVLWVFADIKPSDYGWFIVYMAPLMFTLTVIQMFIGPKPGVFLGQEISWLSSEGFAIGLRISFRLITTGMGFIMFSMTTDPFDTGLSLYQWGLPYRISYMFAFALRFFPLLQEELFVIRSALQARSYASVGSSNPVTIVKGVTTSVVPLGVGALRRSQDIALAMERRGLGFPDELGIKRVIFRDIRLRKRDYFVMIAAALLVVGAIFAYGWGGKAWTVLPDETWNYIEIVLGTLVS